MPRSKAPKARFTPQEKGLLVAASKVPEGSRAQEQILSLLQNFTKAQHPTFPSAG